ncbi:MAG: FkbM family methyltransferase [Verrucomicrobiota bacterium]
MKINFSLQRLAKSLMWRFFAMSDMRFRLRSGLEVPVADRHEMATFREIFIQQEYDDFLDRLPPAGTVLDLGCNSGYFAVQMLNRARVVTPDQPLPKLVLVDANQTAVERAKTVVSGCGAQADVALVHGLIGSRGQTSASFYLATASAESSAVNRTKHARQVEVPCVDLAALVQQHFPGGLDLIKCDIEGGEEELIREWTDVLVKAKALLIEWHGFKGGWTDFLSVLEQAGFQLMMERPAGRYKNALFVKR